MAYDLIIKSQKENITDEKSVFLYIINFFNFPSIKRPKQQYLWAKIEWLLVYRKPTVILDSDHKKKCFVSSQNSAHNILFLFYNFKLRYKMNT